MLHKIVYNRDYGGFSLSLQAIDWLEQNGSEKTKQVIQKIKDDPVASEFSQHSKELHIMYGVSDYFNSLRHDPDLVAVVEALGDKADGECAHLAIMTLDCNMYRIETYDGYEDVITPDNDHEWIVIEEIEQIMENRK